MKNILLASITLFMIGCSAEPETQVMGGKFSSMSQCLETIKNRSGQPLRPMTDTPEKVTGYLGDTNLNFYCGVKQTGTEGTYIEGWFDEPVTN